MQPEQSERISQFRLVQNQLVLKYESGQQQTFEAQRSNGMVPALWQDEKGVLRFEFKNLKPNPQIKLLEISYIDFEYLPELSALNSQKISMTNVQSKGIYDFALGTYDHLVQLDLSFNRIKGFLPLIKAPKLEKLNLKGNSITSLHSSNKFLAFTKGTYDNLLYLNLSRNPLKVFPQIKAPKLKELKATQCQLQNVQVFSKKQFPSLEILVLLRNKLPSLPKLKMPKLKNLNAYSCKIIDLDAFAKEQYPQLEILDISNNLLSNLPKFNMPKLKNLNASECQIRNIQSFFEGIYPCLEVVNVEQNGLDQIFRINCVSLKTLQLGHNQIEDIFDFAQGDYPNLVNLNLRRNSLKNLPRLVNAPKLEQLHVDQNQLESLEVFAEADHPNLMFLSLSSNKLSQFPLIQSKRLSILDLSNNQIMWPSCVSAGSEVIHEDKGERSEQERQPFNRIWFKFMESSAYRNLIELNLTQSNLKSVEFLQFLDLSNLLRLQIISNKIVEAKSLLKLYFPQIEQCDLISNKLIGERIDTLNFQNIFPWQQFREIDNLYIRIKFKVHLFSQCRQKQYSEKKRNSIYRELARNQRVKYRDRDNWLPRMAMKTIIYFERLELSDDGTSGN